MPEDRAQILALNGLCRDRAVMPHGGTTQTTYPVRTSEEDRPISEHPGVYHLLVRTPKGQEQDVVVQVDASAVAMVERLIRRSLPIESSFWQSYAEHTLATYVWDEGQMPSVPLTITQVDRRGVDLASRWEQTVR